jgi:DNA oxidative demethylase
VWRRPSLPYSSKVSQHDLFDGEPSAASGAGPEGFAFRAQFITAGEEDRLVAEIEALRFSDVVMRGAVAKRRTVHFGWTYGYYSRRTEPGPPLPAFLIGVRDRAAEWAGIDREDFVEALITEYPPGAAIGWHRDAPMFGDVVAGISLLAAARMKFRPYIPPAEVAPALLPRRTTHAVELAARSAYLIAGPARHVFEHSIPAVSEQRYSITFRTLRTPASG